MLAVLFYALLTKTQKRYNNHMEHNQPRHEQLDHDQAPRLLGELLAEGLDYKETPPLQELHATITDATAQGDAVVALAAYARYQELAQEFVDTWEDQTRARLAYNVATARLLAERREWERCREALNECVADADGLGFITVADGLYDLAKRM